LSDNITSLPNNTFNLIISHLVTQHIDLKTLTDQIKNVVRALKDDGIFAMQFAYSTYSQRTTEDPTLDNIIGGGMCRTLGQMDDIVSSVDGEIVWAKKTLNCQYWHSGWYAVHIVKRNSTNNKHKWLMV
jgi:cyclopropane fatty-acyl-phospholipid synthase-like methyltransferase